MLPTRAKHWPNGLQLLWCWLVTLYILFLMGNRKNPFYLHLLSAILFIWSTLLNRMTALITFTLFRNIHMYFNTKGVRIISLAVWMVMCFVWIWWRCVVWRLRWWCHRCTGTLVVLVYQTLRVAESCPRPDQPNLVMSPRSLQPVTEIQGGWVQ